MTDEALRMEDVPGVLSLAVKVVTRMDERGGLVALELRKGRPLGHPSFEGSQWRRAGGVGARGEEGER
jgi:hypothetical protein